MLIRHMLRRFLENRGFSVETAADGAEALALLKTARPQLILTDIKMPNVDGHKLIQAVSADPELSTVPVVILAAKPLPGESTEMRANSVIYKDFNIETQLNLTLDVLFPTVV
jgi:CheY-like chemotaxis protein